MTKIALAAMVILFAGCVSESTMLRNDKGQTVQCKNFGFGLIGTPVALAQHADCVKKAKVAGYSDVPK